jgi:hypothetical protein
MGTFMDESCRLLTKIWTSERMANFLYDEYSELYPGLIVGSEYNPERYTGCLTLNFPSKDDLVAFILTHGHKYL